MSLDTIGMLLLDLLVWFCNLQFSTKKILSNCLVTTIIITRRCLNPARDYSGHMHAKCHFFPSKAALNICWNHHPSETSCHKVFFFLQRIVNLWFQDVRSILRRLKHHPFIVVPESNWPLLSHDSWCVYVETQCLLPQCNLICAYAVHDLCNC